MKTKDYLSFFIFVSIITSAIFLRFYNYNFQDFWWDELVTFLTVDPSLSLKETYLRAHSHTIGTDLDYDYAENALTLIFINHLVSMIDSFLFEIVSNGTEENLIHTSPIYNIDNKKVEGIQLSLKW